MRTFVLVLFTVGIVAGAAYFWRALPDLASRGLFGDFSSAVVAAIAFLWLAAGYFQQNRELRLQRRELELQREALRLQREEMHRLAEQATLGQIATMLSEFNSSIPQRDVSDVSSVADLPRALAHGAQFWTPAMNAGSAQERYNSYARWAKVEGIALHFLGILVSAIRAYSGV